MKARKTEKMCKKRVLKFVLPVSAICTIMVVAAITIPIVINRNDNQTAMKPISNDLFSFYLNNTSFGSADLPEGTSVGSLYDTYKQYPEKMNELAQRKEIFNLTAEYKFHCYYVTKEVLDAVNKQFVPLYDYMLPWRGLTAYCYGYYALNLENTPLMEIELNSSGDYIKTKINNYYLLDIVRFYSDSSINNYYWIDFVNYSVKTKKAIINTNELKESINYCTCTFANPNKLSKKDQIYNYSYLCILDFHGFEIEKDNNREIAKDTFAFDSRHADADNDVTYYDDINKCILSKELLSSNDHNGYSYQVYNVIFDYDKLIELFGF